MASLYSEKTSGNIPTLSVLDFLPFIRLLPNMTMITLKCNSTFGNYAWTAEAEVEDNVRDVLASYGLLQVLQRSPASAAEKAMAGYEKRPDGFKRGNIPFDATNAQKLAKFLESAEVETGRDDKGKAVMVTPEIAVTVTEYVPEEGGTKFAAERRLYVAKAAKLDKLAALVGYDGEVGDGTADGAPEAFLTAIRAWTRSDD
jgi:hypothetical protein